MQKLGRLLTMLAVLALGLGMPLHVLAGPGPMDTAGMTAESHAMMAGMEGASSDCSTCAGEPGMMLDCLPTCMSVPALAPQTALRFPWRQAGYDRPAEQSFTGAHILPDPYPPRPIIVG